MAAVLQGFTITGGFGTLDIRQSSGWHDEGVLGPRHLLHQCLADDHAGTSLPVTTVPATSDTINTGSAYHYGGGIAARPPAPSLPITPSRATPPISAAASFSPIGKVRASDNLDLRQHRLTSAEAWRPDRRHMINNTIVANEAATRVAPGRGRQYLRRDRPDDWRTTYLRTTSSAMPTSGGGLVWYEATCPTDLCRSTTMSGATAGRLRPMDETAGVTWTARADLTGRWGTSPRTRYLSTRSTRTIT